MVDAASAVLGMAALLAGAAAAVFFAVTIFFSPGTVHGQAQVVPTPTPTPTLTPTPTPEESSGAASESVQIRNLASNLTAGNNYDFIVRASSLDSTLLYRISIQTVQRNIGFDELEEATGEGEEDGEVGVGANCGFGIDGVNVPSGRTFYNWSVTLKTCDPGPGTLTAILYEKAEEPGDPDDELDRDTHSVTVKPGVPDPTDTPTPTPKPPPTPTPTPTPRPPPTPTPTPIPPTLPVAPVPSFTVTPTGSNAIYVNWSAKQGVSEYDINYRAAGTSKWTSVIVEGPSGSSRDDASGNNPVPTPSSGEPEVARDYKTITGLDCTKQHQFRMSALGDGLKYSYTIWSAWSAIKTATPRCEPELTATNVTHKSATLSLANHSGNWWYKYTSPSGGACSSTVTGGSTNVTGLTANRSYTFKAYSASNCASSAELDDVSFTTLAAPTLTATNITHESATLNIANHSGNWWYQRTTPSGGSCTAVTGSASVKVTGLTASRAHTFKAYSASTCASGVELDDVSFTTLSPPPELTATNIMPTSATLNLANHSGNWWYQRTTPSGGSCTAVTGSASVKVTGLTANRSHTFKAYSASTCASGVELDDVSFTTLAAPTLTATNVTHESATLSLANHSGNWWYQRTTPSGGSCTAVTGSTSVKVTGLTANRAYTFKAYSASTCASSVELDDVSFTTPELTATNIMPTSVTLSLANHSGNWWYEHTTPSGGTCTAVTGSTSVNVATLTANRFYTFGAYSASNCASSAELADVSFTTPPLPELTATNIMPTSATLSLANHSGDWWYKYTKPSGGMCSSTITSRNTSAMGLTQATSYTFKAYSASGCPNNAELDDVSFTTLAQLATPTNFDVTPLPLRKARLSWGTVANATGYVVEMRKSGATQWQRPNLPIGPPSSNPRSVTDGSTVTNSYVIDLDEILNEEVLVTDSQGNKKSSIPLLRGLANSSAYEFQVKATAGSGHKASAYSAKVTLIDSPITSINGKSTSTGQAVVRWNAPSGVTGYTLRWREMPDHVVQEPYRGIIRTRRYDHSKAGWRPNPASPTEWVTPQNSVSTAASQYRIPGLKLEEVYAVQINYTTSGGEVFSARERYVWPSAKDFPGNGERVATYPYFGHFENSDYLYRVCKETFLPVSAQDHWVDIIEHAFEQWEIATERLVTLTPDVDAQGNHEPCTDMSIIRWFLYRDEVRATDNALSEVRMIDDSGWSGLLSTISFIEMLSDPYKACIFGGTACVTSIGGYGGNVTLTTGAINPLFITQASNVLPGVDVTFKYGPFKDSLERDIPGNNPTVDATDIQFNACLPPPTMTANPDDMYKAYRTAVHEAGHALGISAPSLIYSSAHPTIPDSVLNYDWNGEVLQGTGKANLYEPDCSPHPFDVLAIYALYQNKP